MITCEEFFAEFADYMENQVSPEVRQNSIALAHCRACHVLYDTARKTVKFVTEVIPSVIGNRFRSHH
jgi:hypothetical protein